MFKVILAPVDGSEYDVSIGDYAEFIHESWNSEVIALHVVDIIALEGPFFHDLSGAMGMEPLVNLTGKMKELLEEQGRMILENFCEKMKKSGITCQSFLDSGIVSNRIVEKAKLADLIIMGKRGIHSKYERDQIGSTTEGVLRKTPTSLLIVPEKFREIKKPLLAYDGSKVARRAMELAAHFSEKLSLPLGVVTVASPSKADRIMEEVEIYMKPFSIDVEYIKLEGSPHHEIEQLVKKEGFDMLVLGAVGHHFLIEMIVGSTAMYLLRNLDVPFLVSR